MGDASLIPGIDISLETEDHQEASCHECNVFYPDKPKVALFHLFLSHPCDCIPHPDPICLYHKGVVEGHLLTHGPLDWGCNICGAWGDVLDIRRIPR